MTKSDLASQVASILSAQFDSSGTDSQVAGDRLYIIVRSHFKRSGMQEEFDQFENNSKEDAARRDFTNKLVQELSSAPKLRQDVIAALSPAQSTQIGSIYGSGGSVVGGRDVTLDNSTTTNRNSNNTRTSYTTNRKSPGATIAVVAVTAIILIIVIVVLKSIIGAIGNAIAESTLSGESTCADYIASSDQQEKTRVMKSLYLKYQKTEQAADPFIVQNVEYICGDSRNQKVKLERVAAKS